MKVGLTAIKGKIAKYIAFELYKNNLVDLSSALIREGYDEVGMDIGEFLGIEKTNSKITDDISTLVRESDVIIDFSSPELTLRVAEEVSKQGKTLITGTRFLLEEEMDKLIKFSNSCKIIHSENMSISFNLLLNLIEDAASILRDEYTINISSCEDSKTDLSFIIAKTIANTKGWNNIYKNIEGENSINFTSINDKNKNEYTVSFTTFGENIKVKQSTYNITAIISGVMRAIMWSDGKSNGFYTMQDVLKLK